MSTSVPGIAPCAFNWRVISRRCSASYSKGGVPGAGAPKSIWTVLLENRANRGSSLCREKTASLGNPVKVDLDSRRKNLSTTGSSYNGLVASVSMERLRNEYSSALHSTVTQVDLARLRRARHRILELTAQDSGSNYGLDILLH
jgi:hypothetical protein